MKSRLLTLLFMIVTLPLIPAVAQDHIVFNPFDPGAPEARVGGSIRGAASALTVAVLAPSQLAVTTRASTPFYWFASAPVTDPVEFVLIEEGGEEPLAEVVLEPPLQAGIHAFETPETVRLKIGSTYQWSVAVVPDPQSRSHDVFASALMTRVMEPTSLADAGDGHDRAIWLASLGIWYDAISVLGEAINAGGNQADAARLLRARLLEQVGLSEVAQFERQEMHP